MAANTNPIDHEFKVVTGEKDDTIIVLLFGQIRSQEIPKLDELMNFLMEKPQPTIIISLRDVTQFLPGAHATWTKVQSTLRKAGRLITVCSIKPDIKTALIQAGVLRESETFNNIPDCWQALKVRLSEVAKSPTPEPATPETSAASETPEKKAA